ncbi:MAG: SDR family oxidoreductase [Collimonas sp.]|uniref:SDR family NAD(P)-dependent oxidoreductase n=1 Tax=Collimonas sp. TaxID=1963772 RepID=UPI003264E7F9
MTTHTNKGRAVITGASSGVGAVYANRLANRGYDLILVARNREKLGQVSAAITEGTGRKVDIIQADLTVPSELRALEEKLASDESISMLVNNAGSGATKSLVDSAADELEAVITLNVTVLTRLTRAIAPAFVKRGNGAIINISSITALAPELLNGSYGGSKAYVLAFTQSLHKELSAKGVTVQAVLPGAIRTAFWDNAGLPVKHLPSEIVMDVEPLVDAALAGLDQGELVTIPSLPEPADWRRFEEARAALGPNLSHVKPAARYRVAT